MNIMAISDIANPPMVPIARGYQNDSLDSPTMNGIKPKIVESMVRSIGIILTRNARI